MNIIFLGAPGAGKGTQCDIISSRYGIPTISTGNIIRAAVRDGTPMGQKAAAFIDAGKFVPDEVVIGIIRDRLALDDCRNGFILDGFPRNIAQADELERMGVHIDFAVDIEVPDDRIVARMSGRRVCSRCGKSYHLEYNAPKVADVCDGCGGGLVIRKDDAPATVLERLRAYHELTEPLIGYYAEKGKLVRVDGCESLDETTRITLKAVEDAVLNLTAHPGEEE